MVFLQFLNNKELQKIPSTSESASEAQAKPALEAVFVKAYSMKT